MGIAKLTIGEKTANQGATSAGKLTASEFNELINRVKDLINATNSVVDTDIKWANVKFGGMINIADGKKTLAEIVAAIEDAFPSDNKDNVTILFLITDSMGLLPSVSGETRVNVCKQLFDSTNYFWSTELRGANVGDLLLVARPSSGVVSLGGRYYMRIVPLNDAKVQSGSLLATEGLVTAWDKGQIDRVPGLAASVGVLNDGRYKRTLSADGYNIDRCLAEGVYLYGRSGRSMPGNHDDEYYVVDVDMAHNVNNGRFFVTQRAYSANYPGRAFLRTVECGGTEDYGGSYGEWARIGEECVAASERGAKNGIALLDGDGKLALSHRPQAGSEVLGCVLLKSAREDGEDSVVTAYSSTYVNALADGLGASVAEKASAADMAALASTVEDVEAALELKANTAEVNAALSAKADTAYVDGRAPSVWLNVLSDRDTVVKVDGKTVAVPAWRSTEIRDFGKFDIRAGSVEPSCFRRIAVHTNGLHNVAGAVPLSFGGSYTLDGETALRLRGCSSLKELDMSGITTFGVTSMQYMFYGCSSLASLDLGGWDTGAVTDMRHMFNGCSSLAELDLGGWDTGAVTGMRHMFNGCSSLAELDLGGWDTGAVTDMSYMFNGCSSLAELTLGEGFGKMADSVGTLDLSPLRNWTGGSVRTLLSLYDRAANGLGPVTLKLSGNTYAALSEDDIAVLTGRGYTVTK